VYYEYQSSDDSSSALPGDVDNSLLAMPSMFNPATSARGKVVYDVASDGQIALKYAAGTEENRVISEFSGKFKLDGDYVYFIRGEQKVAVGEYLNKKVEICKGEFASVCRFSVGVKRSAGNNAIGATSPIATASFALTSLTRKQLAKSSYLGGYFDEMAPFDAANQELLPYVLASPNQFDAGSCLFMASTGAMEILMNQHTELEEIQYQGPTDLSERYLMSASNYIPENESKYVITDLMYTYNYLGGTLLNSEYPFTAGYVKETSSGGVVASSPDDEDAYFSCYYNWFDELPEGWQDTLISTPKVERTSIFVVPSPTENSRWDVGLMNDDIVERIKFELRTKKTPVIVVYNHYLYWHADIVVGYDDAVDTGGCPMVESSLEYYEEKDAGGYVQKIQDHMDEIGPCTTHGIFYVRDSIYEGEEEELMYSYSNEYTFNEKYSKRIIERSYNWVKYLANHAYSVYRK